MWQGHLARAVCARKANDGVRTQRKKENTDGKQAYTDAPIHRRLIRGRNDLHLAALRDIPEKASPKEAVPNRCDGNTEANEERRYDWTCEKLLHLTRTR